MTHQRQRFIEDDIKKALSYSPCVGLLGMRQVGKTTLLKKFSRTYFTFDSPDFSFEFERRSASLIEQAKIPIALDEIQKLPAAFDVVKYHADRVKRMGRFLLSGSVRFSSRKQIRESLTGRIVLIEILPLSLAECHNKACNVFLKMAVDTPNERIIGQLKKKAWAHDLDVLHYLKSGGLPGICFRRDEKIRHELMANHLDTLLGRDIHLVRQTNISLATLKQFLLQIARRQYETFSMSQIAHLVGVSHVTAQRLIEAMEALFLIRRHGSYFFIEDTGVSNHLNPIVNLGSKIDILRAIYHELRFQFQIYLRNLASFGSYATRGGIDVPFFVQHRNGSKLAIAVSEDALPTNKILKSLTWLKKKHPETRCFVLCQNNEPLITSNDVLCLPWLWIF